jgi:dTDP-4-amino-4,6-dideoxygalactose transaminase
MRIPLTDVSWQHRTLRPEIEAAVWRLLDEQTCDGSVQILELEASLGAWLGGVLAAGVQSGTAGIFLALKALDIGTGDEVITIANSDLATTAAVSHTGARFVLVDVDPVSYTMDVAQVEAAITPRTRVIMPVHLYGHPADMDAILEIARRRGLLVVEDACLALGAEYKGRWCGTMGHMGVYSFAPRKMIGGAGNGGAVVTRDPDLNYRVRQLRGYGLSPALSELPIGSRLQQPNLPHETEGYNLRLDGMNAAIVNVKLTRLHEWLAHRRAVADRYAAHFAGTAVISPKTLPGCRHSFRNYAVQLPHRDAVRAYLRELGIVSSVLYAPPVHLQPVYQHLGLGPGSFPVAEALAERNLCLPMYPGLALEAVDEIAQAVLEGLRQAGGG